MSSTPFFYELPRERIAQRPVRPYHNALLLVGAESSGAQSSELEAGALAWTDSTFLDLSALLEPGDLLLFNRTKVLSARLFGSLRRESGAGSTTDSSSVAEVLLLEEGSEPGTWLALARPLKKIIRPQVQIDFGEGLSATAVSRIDERRVLLQFLCGAEPASTQAVLARGVMPIPPYIRSGKGDEQDRGDYQSLFAEQPGSVAAPTASLHFTTDLLDALHERDVATDFLTLHVGAASFLPLYDFDQSGRLEDEQALAAKPGAELVDVPPQLLVRCQEVRERGGRVIAVGTTVTRALESAARGITQGATDLFIEPGFEFQVITHLITNFHQPGTTHLLIVEAAIGRKALSYAYHYALEHNYRFLSYGDGMLIPIRRNMS